MAEGRSNSAIASGLVVTEEAISKGQHLHEARPHAFGRRQPPGHGGPRLPERLSPKVTGRLSPPVWLLGALAAKNTAA